MMPLSGLVLFVVCLAACNDGKSPAASAVLSSTPASAEAGTVPRRVISLAPGFTEMMFTLGEQDRLVGVTPYCRFPAEAASKPKVGALLDVDYERMSALRPDLILCVPAQRDVARRMELLGVPSLVMRSETVSDIESALGMLAGRLGVEDRGNAELLKFRERLAALRARWSGRNKPRVLFVVGRNPGTLQQLYACGSGNFLNEILDTIGVENILGMTEIPWPLVNKERILALDPDLILDSSVGQGVTSEDPGVHMRAWEQLPSLSAVRHGRVVVFQDDHLLIPGPGFIDSADRLAELIRGTMDDRK